MKFLVFLLAVCMAWLGAGCASAPPVSLALLGDIQLGRGVAAVHHQANSWARPLEYLHPTLQGADLALGNLESPLAKPEDWAQENHIGEYNLCAPAESTAALLSAGLDILALANNHRDDCLADGDLQTGQILAAAGLAGIPADGSPLFQTMRGLRLAFLAFDDTNPALDKQGMLESVQQAAREADAVIVSLHWGAEYQAQPTERQQALARQLAEAGADLVWGHHPHVLQPLELVERPGGRSPTLVAYSLGNALFDQPGGADTNRGAVLIVRLNSRGVQAWDYVPFEIDPRRALVQAASGETQQRVNLILEYFLGRD